MTEFKPYPYQRACIDFVKMNRPYDISQPTALLLDMGLGKTIITLTALYELGVEGKLRGNVLVIAPLSVSINTWSKETAKWDHLKNIQVEVLTTIKNKKKRHQRYEEIKNDPIPKIYTINISKVADIIDYFGDDWCFPNIVLDELQKFRSHSAKCVKSMQKLHALNKKVVDQAIQENNRELYENRPIQRIIGLTGTPAPKGLINLWGEISSLDGGLRLGKNITAYRNTFFKPGRCTSNGDPYEWLPLPYADYEIYRRIQDICISMKSEDYLQLPDVVYNYVDVEMSTKEKEVYEYMRQKKVLPLADEVIRSKNSGVLVSKLLQLANGAIYGNNDLETNEQSVYEIHKHKLEKLEEIEENAQGESILVFYWFKHDLERLKKAFPHAEVYDPYDTTVEDRWNNKEIPMLLAFPKAIGIGTNIQEGGHIIVWYSLPMCDLELYQQSNKRLHRNGQKHTTIIHHLLTKGTIDEDVIKKLQQKAITQEDIIDALKAHL